MGSDQKGGSFRNRNNFPQNLSKIAAFRLTTTRRHDWQTDGQAYIDIGKVKCISNPSACCMRIRINLIYSGTTSRVGYKKNGDSNMHMFCEGFFNTS